MSEKNIIFNDKKINKVISAKTRNYLRQMELILIKY